MVAFQARYEPQARTSGGNLDLNTGSMLLQKLRSKGRVKIISMKSKLKYRSQRLEEFGVQLSVSDLTTKGSNKV